MHEAGHLLLIQGKSKGGQPQGLGLPQHGSFSGRPEPFGFEDFPVSAVDESYGGPVDDALNAQRSKPLQIGVQGLGFVGGKNARNHRRYSGPGQDLLPQQLLGLLIGVAVGQEGRQGAGAQTAIQPGVKHHEQIGPASTAHRESGPNRPRL